MLSEIVPRAVAALTLCVVVPIVSLGIQSVENLYMMTLPTTHWFEYESVEPVKNKFNIGEELQFISTNKTTRITNYLWEDTLYCDFGQGFGYYSQYISSYRGAPVKPMTTGKPWTYHGATPMDSAQCYLRSHPCHEIEGLNPKCQDLQSKVFIFVAE